MQSCAPRQTLKSKVWLVTLATIACGGAKRGAFGFSAGQYAIEIASQSLRIRAEEKWLTGTNRECSPCHESAYNNWNQSRHRVAFTNELYREEHEIRPSAWCVNCHAPLAQVGANPLDPKQRIQAEDGISCNVCHVRDNKVIVSKTPLAKNGRPAHDYLVEPSIATAKFCADCHDFPFPAVGAPAEAGRHFNFAALPMQETYTEWSRSGFSKTPCQQCHLLGETNLTHRFSGGHDKDSLSQSLKLEAERAPDGRLRVRVYSIGIGHAFPTGDLFRTLRVYLSPNGRSWRELSIGKVFQKNPHVKDPSKDAGKVLVSDTSIPAPVKGEFVSVREYALDWPADSRQVKYELQLDYTHPHSKLLSKLPMSAAGLTFQNGNIRIRPAAALIREKLR